MRRGRCRRRLALVGVVCAGAIAVVAPAATATPAGATARASTGACADGDGVTVVVDFASLGGGVQVRCAGWPVSSGFDALTKAGFTFEGAQRYPGLLCRIDGKPASDPCVNAPPAKSYWGYWHAKRGGDWRYATSGAGSYKPPKGSVEGWAFGDSPEPGIAPPAPVATTTTTSRPSSTTTTSRPSATGGPSGTTTSTLSSSATAVPADGVTTTTAASAGTDSGSSPTTADAPVGNGEQVAAASTSEPSTDDSGGSPVGVIAALVGVGLLGGGAAWTARRRARQGGAS